MGTTAVRATCLAPRPPAPSEVASATPPTRKAPDAGHHGRHRAPAETQARRLWLRFSRRRPVIAFCLFCLSLALYLSRLAPSVVPGDPGEYQLVAARWGIGHPPGYGFYALVGNVFTHLLPLGSFAWRANVFAAVCAAAMVALCYSIGRLCQDGFFPLPSERLSGKTGRQRFWPTLWNHVLLESPAIVGALALAAGIGFWQHAIHANAHILTALLGLLTLHSLILWWYGLSLRSDSVSIRKNHWLYVTAFLAGVSPTQHPLLVFAFPAYVLFGLFVLWTFYRTARAPDRPGLGAMLTGRDSLVRVLLGVVGFGLLGLCSYLYYPIRSAISAPPLPGPSDMHTWAGFLRIVTAQGLRGNLLGFTPGQILQRLWDVRVPLLRQFSFPGLLLIGLGWGSLWWPKRRSPVTDTGARRWHVALLLSAYLACVVLVTVNVLQDAVAYLLGPMAVFAVLFGLGVQVVMRGVSGCVRSVARATSAFPPAIRQRASGAVAVAVVLLLAILPFWSLGANWTRMDLSSFRDAEDWLAAVEERFVGRGQYAVVLAEWERMTTVYYKQAVEGRGWNEEDLRFVPISAGTEAPFLRAAERHLAEGPVYLTIYRPQVAAHYRLLPVPLGREFSAPGAGWSGTLWQVLPAWPHELPPARDGSIVTDGAAWANGVSPVSVLAGQGDQGQIEIVGWRLVPDQGVSSITRPGDVLALDLFMRLPPGGPRTEPESVAYYLPWVRLGETTYYFTTDSRFNTPWWQPGEIVVERFELPVPWQLADAAAGASDSRRLEARGVSAQMHDTRRLALEVGIMEVSQGRELHVISSSRPVVPAAPGEAASLITLASVPVAEIVPDARLERELGRALGNLRGEILLRGARIDGRRVNVHDDRPFVLRPGQKMRVVLEWESLRPIGDNYKVFVQLLDAGLRVRAQGDDKAPLGGSAPTLLWFPRWREGTRITDTYLLDVPSDLPSGTYPLIVGMYGFSTFRRLQVVSYDADTGNPVVRGDWITLAHLQVE